MSTLERTIAIIFEGDDQSKGAFTSVTAGLQALEDGVRGVTKPLADVADTVLELEGALGLLATGAMVLAVQRAGEFTQATSEVSTLISDTTFDIGAYRNEILAYAATSTQSISSITSSLYSAVSAGVSWEDSIEAVSAAEKLAVAGKAELQQTTVALISTLNAYGAGMDEAEKYSDALFQTVKLGQTTLPELSDSLANVTTIAASAGIPIETLGAAIADMTAKGMGTEIAITSLRQIISSIIDPTTGASKAAEALGIEFSAAALKSQGLEGVLLNVYSATGGNVEEITKLFGNVRALTGVLALFGADGGDAFLSKLEQMLGMSKTTEEAYAKMVDEIKLKNQTLINNMEATFIKFGLMIQDEAIGGVDALIKMFQSLNQSVDAGTFNPIINVIKEFLNELIVYINETAEVLPQALANVNWDSFTASLQNVVEQVKALFNAIFPEDLTTAEGLGKAIQKVVDALTNLNNITAGILESWQPVFKTVGLLIEEFGRADSAVVKFAEEIGKMLGGAQILDKLIDKFGLLGGIALQGVISGLDGANWAMAETNATLKDADEAAGDAAKTWGEWLTNALGKFKGSAEEAEEAAGLLGKSIEDLTKEDYDLYVSLKAELDSTKAKDELETFTSEARFVGIYLEFQESELAALSKSMDEVTEARYIGIVPSVDKAAVAEVEKSAQELAKTRQAEIEWSTKLDIAKTEAEASVAVEKIKLMGEAIKWNVELEIEETKAMAEMVSAAFGTLASAFDSSGQVISSAIDAYASTQDTMFDLTGKRSFIENVIKSEMALRERAMDLTEALIATQIEYMNSKIKSMQRGEALITVDGAGLQPHLEAFMWEILSAIQIRVNEEGHAMLFGM